MNAVIGALLERDAFSRLLGMQVLEATPGHAVVRMTVRDDMVNGFGTLHGGALFSLADSAFAFATNAGGTLCVAVDTTLSIPAASYPGDVLTATAETRSTTNRLEFVDVTVRKHDGTAVGYFRGTVYRTTRSHTISGDG